MPYKSLAQERWAHTPSGEKALGKEGVKEWDSATKGKSLPERAQKMAYGGFSKPVVEHGHVHLVTESPEHFDVTPKDPGLGFQPFRIAKKGLSAPMQEKIRAMCAGGKVQKMAGGGDVVDPNAPLPFAPQGSGDDATPSGSPPGAVGPSWSWPAAVGAAMPPGVTALSGGIPAYDYGSKAPAPKAGEAPGTAADVAEASAGGNQGASQLTTQDKEALDAIAPHAIGVPAPSLYSGPGKGTMAAAAERKELLGEKGDVEQASHAQSAADVQAQMAREAALNADYHTTRAQMQAALQKTQDELAASKIDPEDFWNHRGLGTVGSRIGAAIGILLSGYGQGRQGAAGINAPNMALSVLQKRVGEFVDAQKANLNTKNNLVKIWMDRLGDLDAAHKMALAESQTVANHMIQRRSEELQSNTARNTAALAKNQIDLDTSGLMDKATWANVAVRNQFKEAQATQANALNEAGRQQRVVALGQQGLIPNEGIAYLTPEQRALSVPLPDGRHTAIATSKEGHDQALKDMATASKVQASLDRIDKIRNAPGATSAIPFAGGFKTILSPAALAAIDREQKILAAEDAKQLFSRTTQTEWHGLQVVEPGNQILDSSYDALMGQARSQLHQAVQSSLATNVGMGRAAPSLPATKAEVKSSSKEE